MFVLRSVDTLCKKKNYKSPWNQLASFHCVSLPREARPTAEGSALENTNDVIKQHVMEISVTTTAKEGANHKFMADERLAAMVLQA